ncbi:MAG: 50S ribosomal protein L32 [Candidatus Sumerlaeaceae bacterium]|nr:50S ribosomal protein L32 [Candidatus Sumerlaeaceae bacterium]
MPVPRRRHCPSRKNRRRHHERLTGIQGWSTCPNCGGLLVSHRVCSKCGNYKGRHFGPVKPVKAE